jgi:hypothetical protein
VADPRQEPSLFELVTPEAIPSAVPAQEQSLFDIGLAPRAARSTTTGASGRVAGGTNQESNTLFGNARAETAIGELGAGIQSGVRQAISTAPALVGLGASVLGANDTAASYLEWANQIANGGAQRGIGKLEDLTGNPMTWLRYVAGVTGEAIPFIASILGGAGVGSTLARTLALRGVPAAERALILQTAPNLGVRGAQLGAFGTAAGIETGATAEELFSATGQARPFASLVAGTAKGALESLFPMVLARQYGLSIGQAEGLYGRIVERIAQTEGSRLGRGAVGFGTEAATEYLQEEVDIMARSYFDEKYSALSPDAWSRRLNAAVAGGVGGGIFSVMSPSEASTALNDNVVRDATQETPIMYGAKEDELPSTGPEHILRQSATGLDATAGLASGELLSQSLSEVDLRKRGLYGAVTANRDITFGSQDQANNDYDYYQGSGFLKLDPNLVTRGDVSASVEDLPPTVNDARVDFLDPNQTKEASAALAAAIKLNEKAKVTPNLQRRESILADAEKAYRVAVNMGARIEPLLDGQMILRNPAKLTQLAQAQATVTPQLSEATVLDTRTRPDGRKFFTMQAGTPKARKRPGGKAIDLENVNPNDVTSYPTREMQAQVLSTPAIGRRLSLSAARARGIRMVEGTTEPVKLLQDFVNFLSRLPVAKKFRTNSGKVVEEFMTLVDRGLRLDVAPDSQEFAVLRQLRPEELQDPNRGSLGQFEPGQSRIVKARARRTKAPSVSRFIHFVNEDVQQLFSSQFHNTGFARMVVGVLKGGKKVNEPYVQENSPLGWMLRDLVQAIKLKTDIVLEIVAPGTLDGKGVKYEEVTLKTAGGNDRPVSMIRMDPWFYGRPTEGGKPLTKSQPQARNFVERRKNKDTEGRTLVLLRLNDSTYKKVAKLAGYPSFAEFQAAFPQTTHMLVQYDSKTNKDAYKQILVQGDEATVTKATENPQLAEVRDVTAPDADLWRTAPVASQPPVPENLQSLSSAGKIARRLNIPAQKFYTDDSDVAKFYADFSYETGKLLIAYEWGNLGASEQDLINNAYLRERNAARSLSRQAALARVVAHPVLERAIGERGKKGELYSFEEWLASNIARVMANPDSGIGPVKDFFNKSAKNIKAFLLKLFHMSNETDTRNVFAVDPSKGKAHAVVEDWVRRMTERGLGTLLGEEHFLSEGSRKAITKSIADNYEALRDFNLAYTMATPQRASTFQLRKLLEFIPKEQVEDVNKIKALLATSDTFTSVLEWMLGIHQLAEINPHITGLQDYVTLNRAMENDAVSWASMADKRLRQVQQLPRPQQESLWKLMNDLDSLVYLDPKKLEEGLEFPRWPTADELLKLTKKHKLSAETFDVYREIRKDYLYFLSYMELTGVRNVEETITDPELRKLRIAEIKGEIAALRNRPYFPHMRFGKYAVTVRNNKREVVFFRTYDTDAGRKADLPDLVKKFRIPQNHSIVEDVISDTLQQFQGMPKFALQNVIKTLGLDQENLTEGQKKDKDLLEAMTLEHSSQESFRRRMMNRENTPGYSMDGMRAYAHYFSRSARFVSRMAYADRLQNAIRDVRRTASPVSKDTRTRIADYMQRHYDSNMNPAGDWATLRSMAFSWYFAFVPAAAFVNLTQLPMVTGPYLAGKFGDLQTGSKMLGAIQQNLDEYWKWMRGKEVEESPKQEAVDQAHDDRLIDDGFATELAAISHGSVLSRTIAGSKFQRGVRMVAQWGTAPFAFAERINRGVTFRAAYDIAMRNPDHPFVKEVMVKNKAEGDRLRVDRGWNDRQIAAYLTGAQAVRDTQFEYSRWARPKVFQDWRGVMLMFKSYMQNMLWFMFKSNRGTQARFLLAMLGVAGIMGLPGADDMNEIVKFLSRQLGHPVNPELFLRRMINEYVGTSGPDLFLHGASRAGFGIPQALAGLGIPAPKIDLSGSLSMGKLIPGLAAGLNPGSSSFTEMVGDLTREVAGPVLGVPFSLFQSLTDHSLPADDIKRWERVMPRAARDVSRSSRLLGEQRERDRGGATIQKFDPNDLSDQMDILSIGLGFQPTQLSRQWDYIEARKEVENYWQAQRTLLMSEFFRAVRLKDPEGKADAIDAIRQFNKEVPYKGMGISRDSLSRSVRQRTKDINLRELGLPAQKSLRPIAKELQGQFPEVERRRVK